MDLDEIDVFPWNSNFDTGIAVIDEQHRELVSLINQLAGTLVDENNMEVVRVFDQLAEYANYHFSMEEAIWAEFLEDDSWLSSHQLSHSSFLPRVLEIREHEVSSSLREVIERIVRFLIRWLAFHILDDDKRLSLVYHGVQSGQSLDDAKLAADKKMSGSIRILIDTVLSMYDGLSSRTLDLMRERAERKHVEEQLREANQQLALLATTDQLTGLYNRRHFDDIFQRELKRAFREGYYLSTMMIDVDHFKRVNDEFSHATGDKVLQALGAHLDALCRRPSDSCFRTGGEEFVILSANQPPEQSYDFAEKIRSTTKELQFPSLHNNNDHALTLSIGLVSTIPMLGDTTDSILSLADRRLYAAKKAGRDRVIASGGTGEVKSIDTGQMEE